MKVKLTDICTPKQWKTVPTSKLLEDGYPVYGANGIIGYYNEYNHENPVVAITCRGATCGTINITVPRSYVTGNAMCLDNVCSDVLTEYLYYCLLHYDFKNVISGSAQPQITRQGLEKVTIKLCTVDNQQEIITILGKIKGIIVNRQQQLEKLDELVKARFVEMFGEPLFNTKGWMKMPLVKAAPIKALHGNLLDKIWLLNLDAVESQTGTVLFKQRVQSSEINASTVCFTTKNVLYSKLRPYLNKVVLPDEDGIATSEMIPLCPQSNILNRIYLCYWLRSDAFVTHISEKVAGAKMPRVSMDYFRTMFIELPPIELQNQFAAFVTQVDKSKVVVQKEIKQLIAVIS